jgi:DNA-binding response OmpR family regulator
MTGADPTYGLPRILVVDDNGDLCTVLKLMLEREGYAVECAPNGAKAMKIQARFSAQILITDLLMPERDGIETIAQFRRDHPSVRIIAMSGGSRTVTGEKYLFTAGVVGAEVLLRKPFETHDLLASVRGLVGAVA